MLGCGVTNYEFAAAVDVCVRVCACVWGMHAHAHHFRRGPRAPRNPCTRDNHATARKKVKIVRQSQKVAGVKLSVNVVMFTDGSCVRAASNASHPFRTRTDLNSWDTVRAEQNHPPFESVRMYAPFNTQILGNFRHKQKSSQCANTPSEKRRKNTWIGQKRLDSARL